MSVAARYRERYARVRDAAYQATLERLVPFCAGQLTDIRDIDEAALTSWRQQWLPVIQSGLPWSGWDWAREVSAWRKHVDCFEVAVWSGDQLCGMALGKPSDGRNNISVYLLQGSPLRPHPLMGRVLPIILESAAAYGYALGCREMRLIKPLADALPRYQAMGFRLVNSRRSSPYCVRPL